MELTIKTKYLVSELKTDTFNYDCPNLKDYLNDYFTDWDEVNDEAIEMALHDYINDEVYLYILQHNKDQKFEYFDDVCINNLKEILFDLSYLKKDTRNCCDKNQNKGFKYCPECGKRL